MTGTTWVEESGFLEGPIMITNTHSVGVVRDAVIEWQYKNKIFNTLYNIKDLFWALPVVAETYDGSLNDINGFHIKKEHATLQTIIKDYTIDGVISDNRFGLYSKTIPCAFITHQLEIQSRYFKDSIRNFNYKYINKKIVSKLNNIEIGRILYSILF